MAANSKNWFIDYASSMHMNSKVDLEKWLMEPQIRGCEPP